MAFPSVVPAPYRNMQEFAYRRLTERVRGQWR